MVPPGQVSVPCVGSEKVIEMFPGDAICVACCQAPVRVCPPANAVSWVVKVGPIMVAGPAPYQVERPETSYRKAAMNTLSPRFSMVYPRPPSAGFHQTPVCGVTALLRNTDTLLLPEVATARSGWPLPSKSATATPLGEYVVG